jgi:hypothetical protein
MIFRGWTPTKESFRRYSVIASARLRRAWLSSPSLCKITLRRTCSSTVVEEEIVDGVFISAVLREDWDSSIRRVHCTIKYHSTDSSREHGGKCSFEACACTSNLSRVFDLILSSRAYNIRIQDRTVVPKFFLPRLWLRSISSLQQAVHHARYLKHRQSLTHPSRHVMYPSTSNLPIPLRLILDPTKFCLSSIDFVKLRQHTRARHNDPWCSASDGEIESFKPST